MNKNHGGPAFPSETMEPGMTLRQWYKGMIVCGRTMNTEMSFAETARDIGSLADALIAEDEEFEAKP